MRSPLVVVAAVAASCALAFAPWPWAQSDSSTAVARERSGFLLLPPAAPAGQMVLYGHIKRLTRKATRFELGFDPAWLTLGVTARRAKLQDTASSEVPNDSYAVEEGHRLLTYIVPATARVTVLTNAGTGITSTSIPVAELARIVNGGPHRKLFEPLESGIWIRVRIDTVQEIDQQYQP
jgi:hypothetical protein